MLKRTISIFRRSEPYEERAKGIIMLLFLIVPALVGYYVIYQKVNGPAYDYDYSGFAYEIKSTGFFSLDLLSGSFLVLSVVLLIASIIVWNRLRYMLVLKEAEKGYHEPIMSYDEPITYNHALEEKREFKAGVSRGSQTDFVPVDMTASQVIDTLDRLPLSPNQIRLYMDEYKSWEPVHSYLSKRKQRANIEAVHNIPDKIERGKEMYFPV